jgi:hypothetical protein
MLLQVAGVASVRAIRRNSTSGDAMMNPEDRNAAAESDRDACQATGVSATKRAYVRPKLTVLGSVRELTLQATGSHADQGLGMQRN